MEIPLPSLIFQGIPEQIAIVTLALVIVDIPLKCNKVILTGITLAFIAYILRLFPITFGVHTIILMVLLFIMMIRFYQAPLLISLRAILISFFVLIIVEYICFTLITHFFDISFNLYNSNVTLRILIGLPQVFVIFLLAYIIFRIRKGRIMM